MGRHRTSRRQNPLHGRPGGLYSGLRRPSRHLRLASAARFLSWPPAWRRRRRPSTSSPGIFATAPHLKELVENETADTISLASGVDITIRPASFRTIRGITAVAAIADEIAFWRSDDSANPDTEILRALRPALATTGGLLAAISSPHAKRGELYSTFKRHFGPTGHPLILVAKAPSRTMNPSLSQRVVDRAYEEDPEAASAEYGAEFRGDLAIFVSRDAIEACVATGVLVRAPIEGVTYFGFVDPSGGSNDAMTMAIAHNEGGRVVLDCIG